MEAKYTLKGGPSKFDLTLGLLDKQIVSFHTVDGQVIRVRVHEVKNRGGRDKWRINGYIVNKDGNCRDRREYTALFSTLDRTGEMNDFGPESDIFTFKYLDGLSDQELLKETVSNRHVAGKFKRDYEEYIARLSGHDRLVVEAYVAQAMAKAVGEAHIGHSEYVSGGRQGRPIYD